jgi:hypothetical protein
MSADTRASATKHALADAAIDFTGTPQPSNRNGGWRVKKRMGMARGNEERRRDGEGEGEGEGKRT